MHTLEFAGCQQCRPGLACLFVVPGDGDLVNLLTDDFDSKGKKMAQQLVMEARVAQIGPMR
jgi:hypothetical protein